MKKLVAILICLTLLNVAGCALVAKINPFLSKVEQVLCDPTVGQVADAIAALSFLQANPAIAAAVGAGVAVFHNIRDRICVTIPQLQEALYSFDKAVAMSKMQGVTYRAVPQLDALRAAVK